MCVESFVFSNPRGAGGVGADVMNVKPEDLITDKYDRWYIPGRKKPLGKITTWVSSTGYCSVAAECYAHVKCRRPFGMVQAARWDVDTGLELKTWLLEGVKKPGLVAKSHMGMAKPLTKTIA